VALSKAGLREGVGGEQKKICRNLIKGGQGSNCQAGGRVLFLCKWGGGRGNRNGIFASGGKTTWGGGPLWRLKKNGTGSWGGGVKKGRVIGWG